jgi:hypothetical protein
LRPLSAPCWQTSASRRSWLTSTLSSRLSGELRSFTNSARPTFSSQS